ncbi:pyruvate formate lyase activating enzyme [Desulfocicer vacuolatum DSM 3385]|uniref:Pyruvate formate lyase activating enzyme n=1 Tax=Desulfocicer vacuolatum DSM 3385 TaxID=1121400 RepID=A0A1W2EFK2_9BACT|nr:glycyl-radical enzyme activating protein [Desulfocicer vacuolatum]SMD08096.1 pyruvate formate lyase activating enzyme [Desulfocicer vacuolatum DSM 3385]
MGRIFAIKKYAIHDGPNIRTTVFFKGCPLRCAWCHNPEGISLFIDRIWIKNKCIACGQCLDECISGALFLKNGEIIRDGERCVACGHCVDICPALAHESTGREADVNVIMEEIKKDIVFYDQSGGGVTFSGGEPLYQPHLLLELLTVCKKSGIHRAVDTCVHAKAELVKDVAALTDLFLVDIKHMDSDVHEKFTGVSNGLILENIRLLARMDKEIRFRIPLIEGVNSDPENIEKTGRFIAGVAPESRVDLLVYHEMASSKYDKLGMPLSPFTFRKPKGKDIKRCVEQLERLGLRVFKGG